MKNNVSRLFALLLAVVMLVGILPLAATPVEATSGDPLTDYKAGLDAMTEVIYENDCDTTNPITHNTKYAYQNLDSTVSESGSDTSLRLDYIPVGVDTHDPEADGYKLSNFKTPQTHIYVSHDYIPGNSYTARCWYKTDAGVGSLFRFYTKSSDGYAQIYLSGSQADYTAGEVLTLTITPAATYTKATLMLGSNGIEDGKSAWYDNIIVTETWTVQNALTYGKETITLTADTNLSSFVQTDGGNAGEITVAAGQTLDLNGYTLTAATVNVEDGGKLTDSSGGKGRIAAAVKGNGESETIPVQLADGKYIIVTPKMTGSYVNTVNYTDKANGGFKVALRPGFGKYFEGETEKSVRYDVLANGNGDVALKVSLAWKNVFNQEGTADAISFTADTFTRVYAEGSNYFYAAFTNAGDSQYYDVTVSLIANGFTVSNTLHFENLFEANKTYLFAHNFDGTINSSSNAVSALRGSQALYLTPASSTYAAVVFENDVMKYNGGTKANNANIYGVPAHTSDSTAKVVLEFKAMREAGDSYSVSSLNCVDLRNVTVTHSDCYNTNRLTLVGSVSGGSGLIRTLRINKKDNSTILMNWGDQLAVSEGSWSTVKIVLDYGENTISLTVDGVTSTRGYLPEFDVSSSTYTMLTRSASTDHYHFDDMKVYVID